MSADVLVLGGGPAGATAAISAATRGAHVVLVEKTRRPAPTVCGEFVSCEALARLATLGLDVGALGAVRLAGVRVFAGDRSATCRLPFAAAALPRTVLDAGLLDMARAAGVVVRRGVAARSVGDAGVVLSDGATATAGRVILASGKHDVRGRRRRGPGDRAMVGLKLHLGLAPAAAEEIADAVEIHLLGGGYAGLLPLGGGRANLCLAVDAADLRASGGPAGLLAGIVRDRGPLSERLRGAAGLDGRPVAVAGVPYGFRAFERREGPGWLWPVGDQAAVTPSLTGDGIAIALHTAERAAACIAEGATRDAYLDDLAATVGPQMTRAGLLDALLAVPWAAGLAVRAGALLPSLLGAAAAATRLPGARPVLGPGTLRGG